MKTTVLFLIKHMEAEGGQFVFYSLIAGLSRAEYEPILVCLKQKGTYGEKLSEEGVTVYDHVLHRQLDPGVVPRLAAIIRRHRVQVTATARTCRF